MATLVMFFVILWLLVGVATYRIAVQLKQEAREAEIELERIKRGELY
jgi:hypothetical protein